MTATRVKPHVKARRERNKQLATADAAKRCAYCRTGLDGTARVDYGTGKRYCSQHCWDADMDMREAH